jgi:antitoxin (DNA-binding transcriptional repressor) of toxin-antitoxin stability system
MNVSIVDLRYNMKSVLASLDRNEQVTVLYHGKPKAIITPISKKTTMKASNHPLFGIDKNSKESVDVTMKKLRGGRYNAL